MESSEVHGQAPGSLFAVQRRMAGGLTTIVTVNNQRRPRCWQVGVQ